SRAGVGGDVAMLTRNGLALIVCSTCVRLALPGAALCEVAPPHILTWGSQGSGLGQFQDPEGIALGTGGMVYVTDRYNDRVQAFTRTGSFIGSWGSSGTGQGQFTGPIGIAVNSGGEVFVADGSGRIQVFSPSGVFLR